MNDMFSFERSEWELLLETVKPGGSLSAVRLRSALEAEDDFAVEEALEALAAHRISIDISALPEDFGSGELEKRLRFEAQLPAGALMLCHLEEGDPLRLYLEELASMPAQGDPVLLCERLASGDKSVQQPVLNLFLHRAVEIAGEYTGRGVLMLDLIQEAGLGLWQAVLQYEGGSFEAFADWWIRQSICRLVILQARENGVLRSMQKNMEAYQEADKHLLTELGRNATMEEIAVELGVTPEQADVIRDMILNAAAMEKAKKPQPEQQPEDSQAVEDTAYFQSRQRINELLSALTEQEAKILSLRFGLEGGIPLTAEAVSDRLGLSAQEVVAVEAAALNKLRNGK